MQSKVNPGGLSGFKDGGDVLGGKGKNGETDCSSDEEIALARNCFKRMRLVDTKEDEEVMVNLD
jgi:hypothetical protein